MFKFKFNTIRKWLRVGSSYDVNYSDQILRSIVKTTYAKKKLNILSLMLVTIIVRLHIDAILGLLFQTGHFYVDFGLQILISAFLVIKSGWIYQGVERFDREVYSLTKYLVNNYSDDNYRKWKRYVTFVIGFYLIICVSLIEINSQYLKIAIIQYLICYVIIEVIEKRYQMYDQIYSILNPHVPVFNDQQTQADFEIVQNHEINPNSEATYSPIPILKKNLPWQYPVIS